MTADFDNHYFVVGGHGMELRFRKGQPNSMDLLDNLEPFRVSELPNEPVLSISIDDNTAPIPKADRMRIRAFDTGNGDTIVDRLNNGGYQFIVKDISGNECALIISDKSFGHCRCALKGSYSRRRFGLNNTLMLCYAFATSSRHTLLIHASTVRFQGKGYPFIAKSGTGKSTHVSLWLRFISGCDLMNDDNPIVRIEDGKAYIYGSPWSGKTPCYRNVKAPLGAMTRIDRAPENSIEKLQATEAFVSILPACSSMKWDEDIYNNACNTIGEIIATTGVYILHCRPDKEAALICNKTLTAEQS